MAGHSDTVDKLMPVPTQNEAEAIAQSIIPYARSDARARYLGYLSSGLTIREALRIMGYAHSTLSLWRKDPEFVKLEERIPEFKQQLSMEYANLEFTRNYRLVLEKDYRVLHQSLYPQKDAEGKNLPMSEQDQAYLLKMRSHYTPQQLQIIIALMQSKSPDAFNFTEFVITAARLQERITIEARSTKTLPPIVDKESNGE